MKKILWAVVILLALDTAVFRSGWYSSFLSTLSPQGRSQHIIEELEEMPATPTANILLLGDSRLTEGFNAGVASARVVEHGLRFLPGGSPGTNVRDWSYFLEEVDPDASRFRAVVLTFDSYRKRPPIDRDFDDLARDADVLAPVVSTGALVDLIRSANGAGEEFAMAPRLIVSGLNYRGDLMDLMRSPEGRWQDYQSRKATFGLPMYGAYTGHPENVVGISWNPDARTLQYPERLTQAQRSEIEEDVHKANSDLVSAFDEFNAHWVGRIARRYEGASTRLILLRLPATPIPEAMDTAAFPSASFVQQLQGRKSIVIGQENAFSNLERPEYFFDGRILNADGRRELTRQMTNLLVGMAEEGRIRPH
jgi:hypothetical protein